MRVIAGRLRGRTLNAPPGRSTRPITDQVKESLFNILGHRLGTLGELPDFDVVDLFAGSGALGIEALSRGARRCVFVEHDRAALAALRGNVERLGLAAAANIVRGGAWTVRLPPAEGCAGYGLAFVDPPYRDAEDEPRVTGLLERVAAHLAEGGLIVLRDAGDAALRQTAAGLAQVDERRFGKMRVRLLERSPR